MYIRVYVYTCIHVLLYIVYCILHIAYCILNIVYCICILYMYMYKMYMYIYTYTGIVEGIYEKMIALLLVTGCAGVQRATNHTLVTYKKKHKHIQFFWHTHQMRHTPWQIPVVYVSLSIYIEILCIPHIPPNMNKQKYIPKFRVAPPVSPHKTAGRTVPSSGAF